MAYDVNEEAAFVLRAASRAANALESEVAWFRYEARERDKRTAKEVSERLTANGDSERTANLAAYRRSLAPAIGDDLARLREEASDDPPYSDPTAYIAPSERAAYENERRSEEAAFLSDEADSEEADNDDDVAW